MTTLKTANDMKFNKGDFILQHKNTAFTEIYETDKILGQGMLSCIHFSNILDRDVSEV
jgi:hypothetical protein